MDVFNSALRNPLPPTRKKSASRKPDEYEQQELLPTALSASESAAAPDHAALLDDARKKKNLRRKHRNSHLGCGTCKKRRIKCDEHLPQCFNCVKGKLHCAYLNLDAPARNALRMAQFNQNLRQERNDDPVKLLKEMTAAQKEGKDLPQPPPAQPVPQAGEYYPGFVPFLLVQRPQLANGAPPGQPPRQPPAPGAATLIQSPYGPLMLFQPVAGAAMPAYSVPVQVMPLAQGPQMLYPAMDLVPMQLAPHPMMEQPPMMEALPMLVMHKPDGVDGMLPAQMPMLVPALVPPPQPAPVPALGPLRHSSILNLLSVSGHAYSGASGSPPTLAVPPLATANVAPASGPPSLGSDGGLPSFGSLLNPASLRTSPMLPVRASLLTQLNMHSDPRVTSEDELKLAPIRAGVLTETDTSLNAESLSGKEKVSSINKLLS